MAIELTPTNIISLAKPCQVLSIVDRGMKNALNGGILDERLPIMLYNERKAVEYVNTKNPSDPTLQGISNYLYALYYPYLPKALLIQAAMQGLKPIVAGPSNVSVNVGQNGNFAITATGAGPITFQWFKNGIAIPGAISSSYTALNAQLSDSGSTFFVRATNASGTTTSATATLTVTASITGFLYYNPSDPGPTLQASSDPFVYQNNYTITHNAPISVPIPSAATPNMFLVFKVPSSESAKTTWFNTALNNGSIPDSVFQSTVTFGGFTYYYTRLQASMDSTQPVILT